MFDAKDIKTETPNVPGARLFRFGDIIINLEHVIEIDSKSGNGAFSIAFKFSSGTDRIFTYNCQTDFSLAWDIVLHCVQKNVFNLELKSECYTKWAEYKMQEKLRS